MAIKRKSTVDSTKASAADSKAEPTTRIFYFHGKAHWLYLDRTDTAYDERWSCSLILDDDSQKLFEDSGISTTPKPTDDGTVYTFGKKVDDTFVPGAPGVFNKDGDKLEGSDIARIGRGSDLVAKVEVYPLKRYSGVGHRLLGVKALDIVEREGGTEEVSSAFSF